MSYTIIYKRLFIALPSGRYLPFIQSGDSNLYDVDFRGREVRSRSWEVWNILQENKDFPAVTENEIKAFLVRQLEQARDAVRRDAADTYPAHMDAEKNFGWYRSIAICGRGTTGTTWGAFRNFFMKGIANAIPLADFVRIVGPLQFTWCEKAEGQQFCDWKKGFRSETEDGLVAGWENASKAANDGGPWIQPINKFVIDNIADYLSVERQARGVRIKAFFQDEGHEKYLASTFPLTLTDNRNDAFVFPKSIVENSTAFNGVHLIRALKSMTYEYTSQHQ